MTLEDLIASAMHEREQRVAALFAEQQEKAQKEAQDLDDQFREEARTFMAAATADLGAELVDLLDLQLYDTRYIEFVRPRIRGVFAYHDQRWQLCYQSATKSRPALWGIYPPTPEGEIYKAISCRPETVRRILLENLGIWDGRSTSNVIA